MKKLVWMLKKNMSGSWDFEFMVKQTLKKIARTTKFHITPLGPEAETMMGSQRTKLGRPGDRQIQGPWIRARFLPEARGLQDPGYI